MKLLAMLIGTIEILKRVSQILEKVTSKTETLASSLKRTEAELTKEEQNDVHV